MQTLPNYGIKTAESTDNAKEIMDVVFDANFTIIDTQLKKNEDDVAGVLANENNRIIAEADRVTEFNTLKTESEIATNNAINATTDANNAINDTIEATALANNTNNNMKIWETYDNNKPYSPLNKVILNGSSFINIVACQGVSPLNDINSTNWLLISRKGLDGLASVKTATFTSTIANTTNCVHNLTINTANNDDLQVFFKGLYLEKNKDYTINNNAISIDLITVSLAIGETIVFKAYSAATDVILQALIDIATAKKNDLDGSVTTANTTNSTLTSTIATANSSMYADKSQPITATFTATSANTTVINFNSVVGLNLNTAWYEIIFQGMILDSDNYTVTGNKQITLTGWAIGVGDVMKLKYKYLG